jgi:hypothetical protein
MFVFNTARFRMLPEVPGDRRCSTERSSVPGRKWPENQNEENEENGLKSK